MSQQNKDEQRIKQIAEQLVNELCKDKPLRPCIEQIIAGLRLLELIIILAKIKARIDRTIEMIENEKDNVYLENEDGETNEL